MVDVLLQRHFQGLCAHVDDSGLALRLLVNFVLCDTSSVSLGSAGKAIKLQEAFVRQWKSKGVISAYAVNSGARKNAWTQIHAFF